MKSYRRAKPRRGVLALEWILIITVLVIGVIGGLGLVRNAVILEMNDLSQSIIDLQVDPNNLNNQQTQSLINPDGNTAAQDFGAEFPIPVNDNQF